MFVIRREQVQVFETRLLKSRVPDLVDEVKRRYPGKVDGLPADELERRVDEALARGWGYGLHQDRLLRAFTMLTFCVGPHFDRHPPFRAVLEDPSIGPEAKLDRLFLGARGRDWEAAATIVSP